MSFLNSVLYSNRNKIRFIHNYPQNFKPTPPNHFFSTKSILTMNEPQELLFTQFQLKQLLPCVCKQIQTCVAGFSWPNYEFLDIFLIWFVCIMLTPNTLFGFNSVNKGFIGLRYASDIQTYNEKPFSTHHFLIEGTVNRIFTPITQKRDIRD